MGGYFLQPTVNDNKSDLQSSSRSHNFWTQLRSATAKWLVESSLGKMNSFLIHNYKSIVPKLLFYIASFFAGALADNPKMK